MKYLSINIVILILLVTACKPTKYTDLDDGLYANMETSKGSILLKLEFEKTPITVANFVSLANGTNEYVADSLKGKPFYNGIVFHRVIKDFMIQGGDPMGTGAGSPGYKFQDEFPKDENDSLMLKHDRSGILSMANSGPRTNGSQFFITHKETPWLNGKHTVFGNVVKGQTVVDSIAQNDEIINVEIIQIGKAAKSFKAGEEFTKSFEKYKNDQEEIANALKETIANTLTKIEENKLKMVELPSGLKYVITATKDGEKPKVGAKVKVHYAGYFTDGKMFDTNYKDVAMDYQVYSEDRDKQNGYTPFDTICGPEGRTVAGFKEGLMQMKIGDKAMLFIPAHLAWGAQGSGQVIPPNSDVIFEVEIVSFSD